ncbi:MAG: ribose 5-phosphate isomerase B [Candidatus Desulforudis sp.]|nr:ribose 5-phosphate isomerase B [Desulforudis sp.]
MRIAVASDHGGFKLKQEVLEYLRSRGIAVQDCGTFSEDSVDYPDVVLPVAEAVAGGEYDRAILLCGTGIGVSMVANKVPGVRAAVCSDTFSARHSRAHNDANVLTLGERIVGPGLAREIVAVWLETGFEGGRHARRVDKITAVEEKYGARRS